MPRPPLACLAPLCASLWACATTPVEIHDRSATHLEVRGTGRFDDPGDGAWLGLRVEGARASGTTDQGLSGGDTVVLGGQTFLGPGSLGIDYTWNRAALALAIGRDAPDLRSLAVVGLSWQALELDLTQGAQRASGSDRWVGVLTGAEFTWTPTAWIGLEGRAALTTSLRAQGGELELAVAIAPRSPLTILLGWRWLDGYSTLEGESDLDLGLTGPLVALRGTL